MKKNNVVELTFLFCWPFTILVSLILYFITQDFGFVISYVLGVFSVLMMQSFTYRIMKKTFKENPSKIKSYSIMIYVAKFIFYGIILYVTYQEPSWNIFAAFGGLLTYRVVMFPTVLIFAKKGDKEDEL